MRRAELADGRLLEFPDDTPDEVIAETARRLTPPDPMQPVIERLDGLLGGLNALRSDLDRSRFDAAGVGAALGNVAAEVKTSREAIVAAMTAPKRLLRDEEGRPSGVETVSDE
jgi:hypothetical protein